MKRYLRRERTLDNGLRRLRWFKYGFHQVRDRLPRLGRRIFVISDGRATLHARVAVGEWLLRFHLWNLSVSASSNSQ